MSDISANNIANGSNRGKIMSNASVNVCDKEKSDDQRKASGCAARPTSTLTPTSAATARVPAEKGRRKEGEKEGTTDVVARGGSVTRSVSVSGGAVDVEACVVRTSSNRWRAVGRLLRRTVLAMVYTLAILTVFGALILYTGPGFLLQLLIVALVAYFVAGGRLRWFYVIWKTIPRDTKALLRYSKLIWSIRSFEKKDKSVANIFRQQVERHPNKVCFICDDQEWTFQQVEDYSNKIATIFKSHGYRKGDTIALLLENRVEYATIWLGLSKLGVIVPLINTNLRKTSLLHSVNIARCQALIYGNEFHEAVADIAANFDAKLALYRFGSHKSSDQQVADLKEKDLMALVAETPSTPPVVQDKCCYNDRLLYIYTSGTTGLPKAAVITNSRFIFIASGMFYVAPFTSSDKLYTPLPLYHTAGGIMAIGQALLHGQTVVIKKKFSASSYFSDCIKYNCTLAQYIGEMCRYILAVPPKPEDKQHNLRIIFGNGLRPQIWEEFVKRFNIPHVVEFYGATEGNANIINVDNRTGSIGFVSRIIPSVYPISIIKVNADGEPVRNEKGLCQVCEPNEPGVFIGKIIPNNPMRAFLGYVDKEASKKKIVHDVFTKGDSAFLSGDILVADELGYLYFKDRTGDTFRWKGENVSTSEVEAVVSNLVDYKDCIVYGVEVRGAEGKAGMAAIYDENNTLDIDRLAVNIKEQLPTYARPLFLRILTKIDLTGTFKLKKKDLQEDGYDPKKTQDTLYYLDSKVGYQLLTPDIYDKILQGTVRF